MRYRFSNILSALPRTTSFEAALGEALYFRGEVDQALVHFQEAIRLNPPLGLAGVAWVMATTSNPKFLNGAKAVELAKSANQMTSYKQPEPLDALAAAYAEAGNFPEAISTAQRAAELARAMAGPTWPGKSNNGWRFTGKASPIEMKLTRLSKNKGGLLQGNPPPAWCIHSILH